MTAPALEHLSTPPGIVIDLSDTNDTKSSVFKAGSQQSPNKLFLAGAEQLDGPQRALEEVTREAFNTFAEAMQAAQLSAFKQVRAQFSNLALENLRLREQVGERTRPTTPSIVKPEHQVAVDPDQPHPNCKPSNSIGDCAVLDCMEAFTLPNVLVAQDFMELQPRTRSDAWQVARGCGQVALPCDLPEFGERPAGVPQQSIRTSRSRTRPRTPPTIWPPRASTNSDWGSSPRKTNRSRLFPDKTMLMEQVQASLLKPEYKVSDFYRTDGVAQMVARNGIFESVTLAVILLNSIWIAIDTDHNTDPLNPPVGFVFVENLFCAFFFAELLCRFLAFQEKRNCLRDSWFVFDLVLVTVAVFEIWIMALVGLLSGVSIASLAGRSSAMLRLLRMARLARTARMARLLRSVPELMIMFKGMRTASHAVACTIFLLAVIIYFFALAFRQLTADSELGRSHFRSVPRSMGTLLLRGVLPDFADIVYEMSDAHVLLGTVGVCFVLLTVLVVLNMLAGVLVNVVLITADLEREEADAIFVKNALPVIMRLGDADGDQNISKTEFDDLLLNAKATSLLEQVNVDVMGLVELSDFIFVDDEDSLNFEDFFRLLLKLRGSNTATAKDVVELRKFIVQEIGSLEEYLEKILAQLGNRSNPIARVY